MAYLNLDDVVLHYEVYGQGIPLILLHGNGENLHYFQHQLTALSLEYKVICLDTRGHGLSTRGTKVLTFQVLSDDLFYFMEVLNIKRAHLLGFSDGANIALQFALQHPDKIAGLILNSPNLYPEGMLPFLLLQMRAKYFLLNAMTPVFKKLQKEKELLELMVKQPQMKESMLSDIHMNTLLIAGEHDMIQLSHTKTIARALPHCVLKIIPDGDHFVARKKPEVFNQEVMRFLAGFA